MADSRKYYVISDDNCKFESMTKEEIIAAIVQYMESHEITDVDTGFITTLKEQNHGTGLTFWLGTQAEYNALETHVPNCFYIISDDSTVDDLQEVVNSLQETVSNISGKNGDVLLNETVAYGACDVALSGEHHMTDFSVVLVEASGVAAVCGAYQSGTNIYIGGVGVAPTSSVGTMVTVAVNLVVNAETNKLTANGSVGLVEGTTSYSVAISKITGIC